MVLLAAPKLYFSAPQLVCQETLSGVMQSICKSFSKLAKMLFYLFAILNVCLPTICDKSQLQYPQIMVGLRPKDFFFLLEITLAIMAEIGGFRPEDLFLVLEITSKIMEIGGVPDWRPFSLREKKQDKKGSEPPDVRE